MSTHQGSQQGHFPSPKLTFNITKTGFGKQKNHKEEKQLK